LEDYFFAFAFGGICTGIFELLIRRFWQAEDIKFDFKSFIKFFGIVLFSLMLMGALSRLFHINSIYGIIISFLLLSGIIFYKRPTFIFPSLITALLMMGFLLLFYWGFILRLYPEFIEKYWFTNAISGITLAKVPIEELIWAGSAAMFIGPAARYSLFLSKSV
jgi:hypothetical protein